MRQLLLTSAGLTERTKDIFRKAVQKDLKDIKVILVPCASIKTDSAREGLSIAMKELKRMGIPYENIFIYDLNYVLSADHVRTYSKGIKEEELPPSVRLMTYEELLTWDAILFSGGESRILLDEINRTGFGNVLKRAVEAGLFYIGVSAGSMIAAGNLHDNLGYLPNELIPHCKCGAVCGPVTDHSVLCLSDKQAVWIKGDTIQVVE